MIKPSTKKAYEFFHRGTDALARMEHNGLRVDVKYLDATMASVSKEIRDRTARLKESEVYQKHWRRRFKDANLDSTSQLGTVFFTHLGYKPPELTKTGLPKTDERALETIKHPFVKEFLEIKKLKKVHGTYLQGIKRETIDGLLHPSFNLAGGLSDDRKGGAMSFRGSSSDPNFQNMPIRNKLMGKLIRSAFIPRKGWKLAEIDFSTIEVRIAACVTKDSKLIQYVKDKTKDMHRDAAGLIFHLKPEQISKKGPRDCAKNRFVFPQFYGSYYIDCAKNMWEMMERNEYKVEGTDVLVKDHLKKFGITRRGKCDENSKPKKGTFEYRVKEVEDIFWNDWFKEYTAWKRRWYNSYLRCGYVSMPTGFTAHGVYRRNQVLNLPIQGPAFHCLLWAIAELTYEFEKRGLKSLLVGQIHDCMLIDIHPDETQEVLDLAEEVMTVRLPKAWSWIIVPLEIEIDIVESGTSWNEKQPWRRNRRGEWANAI